MVTKKLKYFEYGIHSNKGKAKPSNFDGYAAFDSPNGYVFVLCDGYDESGEKAKDLALDRIRYFMEKEHLEDPREAVQSALIYTGGYIYEYARKHEENYKNTAVSCLCLLIRDNKIYYSSLGNCNMYLFNGKRLYLLTQETLNNNASDNDFKEKQLLGKNKAPSPFVCEHPLVPLNSDMILLCTDGLYDHVSEKNIKKILSDPMPVYTKACRLTDMAVNSGSDDNVTVQLISFYNLEHDKREFAEPEKPIEDTEELPKTAKIDITGNPLWNKLIIGIVLILTIFMFYDLFIFNPRPARELNDNRANLSDDTITEKKPPKDETKPEAIDLVRLLNRFTPADTVYVVQSGDNWSTIYGKFGVCSWFIRNHEDNKGKFDSKGDPVQGKKILVPLIYSARPEYNPRFYKEFTTDKVGNACQHAGEDFIENFHETLKQRFTEQVQQ